MPSSIKVNNVYCEKLLVNEDYPQVQPVLKTQQTGNQTEPHDFR